MTRVNDAATAGENVVYGDASRLEVHKAAGIDSAKGLIVTYADDRASEKVLTVVRSYNKDIPVTNLMKQSDILSFEKKSHLKPKVFIVLENNLLMFLLGKHLQCNNVIHHQMHTHP